MYIGNTTLLIPEILIAIAFTWFAIQCCAFVAANKSSVARVFIWMSAVFLVTAFSGYLLPVLHNYLDLSPVMIAAIQAVAHWTLVILAWSLALSSAPLAIRASLEKEK